MKNKLKMLFAYFRAFKSKNITTTYNMELSNIEDIIEHFDIGKKHIKPQKLMLEIIEELIELYISKIHRYNNYDHDEYWYLEITIKPFENKIIFQSECNFEMSEDEKEELKIGRLDEYTQTFIKEVFNEYDLHKLEMSFYGRWGDGEAYDVEFDGRLNKVKSDEKFWDLTYNIMEIFEGKYWNEDNGIRGDITIIGDDIYVEYEKLYTEFGPTKLNLIITPDNVIEK